MDVGGKDTPKTSAPQQAPASKGTEKDHHGRQKETAKVGPAIMEDGRRKVEEKAGRTKEAAKAKARACMR